MRIGKGPGGGGQQGRRPGVGGAPHRGPGSALTPRGPGTRSVRFLISAGILLGAAVTVIAPRLLLADGGTLRVSNVPMGAYRVNVFTDPTPIPPDTIDVSVLVTFERGRGIATGLEIMVVARPLGASGPEVARAATREQADDPRYYAANFALGSVGAWELEIRLRGPEGEGAVRFEVEVREPGLGSNPFLILGLALVPVLLVGWWLRKSGGPSGDPPSAASPNGPSD